MKAGTAGTISMLGDGRTSYIDQEGNKRAIYLWIQGTSFCMRASPKEEEYSIEGELIGATQLPVKE